MNLRRHPADPGRTAARALLLAASVLLPSLSAVAAPQTPPEPKPPVVAPPQASGARLDTDALDHDFGSAIEGEKLRHTFHLVSAGTADLVITEAKPSCGCTVAKLEVTTPDGARDLYKFGSPLPPGTQIELEAQLDTKNKHGQASSKINLNCNDPRTVVSLGLTSKVETYYQVTPPTLQFNEKRVEDTLEQSAQVVGKKPGPFLLKVESAVLPDGLKVELTPVEPDAAGHAERWNVKVVLGPACREGNLGFPLILRGDEPIPGGQPGPDGQAPTYSATVMVSARVRAVISADPPYMSFGAVRPGQAATRSLTLRSLDPDFTFGAVKVRLLGASDQVPLFAYTSSFSSRVTPAADGKTAILELVLNGLPEAAAGTFQGRIAIDTGHPKKPELLVPFSGACNAMAPLPVPPRPVPPKGGEPKRDGQ